MLMIPSALKLLASRLLVVAALAGIASAQSTYFQYFSQPGDFVGGGQSGLLTQPLWDFDISYLPTTGVHITIQQAGGGAFWFLDFDSGTGTPLHRGTYLYASRYPFNPPGTAGLSVAGNGSGCNTLWGHFVISQLEIGAGNQVLRFAADFVQHCEGVDPGLFGTIRYQAAAPSLITRLVNYSDVPASYYYVSEPGDFIGQGQTELLDSDAYYFTTFNSDSGTASVYVDGIGSSTYWYLDFANGLNTPLLPGTYNGAVRFPFNPPGVPGLSVIGNGHGCNTLTGSFIVSELVVGHLNLIQRLAVDFEQHCEGSPPGLFGSVRVNSAAPPARQPAPRPELRRGVLLRSRLPVRQHERARRLQRLERRRRDADDRSGTNSVAAADLELLATGLPPGQPALLLAASGTGGSIVGNGRLCIGGALPYFGVCAARRGRQRALETDRDVEDLEPRARATAGVVPRSDRTVRRAVERDERTPDHARPVRTFTSRICPAW
jgi:hypothetical protein